MGDKAELDFVSWLRNQTTPKPWVTVGPGDDTAVLSWPTNKPCLVTSDMLLDGSCFILAEAGAQRVGRKAMNVNLSDIAAMAQRHVAYGVKPAQYKKVGEALLWTLEQGLGNDYTPQVKEAWTKCYTTLANAMINASAN